MLQYRFDWSEQSVSVLKQKALEWLGAVDWDDINERRDEVLLQLLEAKSKTPSLK
jgi:hypothetical protein